MARHRTGQVESGPGLKVGPKFLKGFGLLVCSSMLSTGVWLGTQSSAQEPAGSPFDAFPAQTFQPVAVPGSPGPQVYRNRVLNQLRQARERLQQGERQEALRLAALAQRMAEEWGVTLTAEESPQRLVAEIQGHAPVPGNSGRAPQGYTAASLPSPSPTQTAPPFPGNAAPQTVLPASGIAEAPPATSEHADSPAARKELASRLLQSAREDLANGQIAAARDKAMQVASMDVAFGAFDVRPEHILSEIASLQPAQPEGPSEVLSTLTEPAALPELSQPATEAPAAAVTIDPKVQATQLLATARQSFARGHHKEARELALQAHEFNVSWSLFEDRPEHLLAEIERSTSSQIYTASASQPARETVSPVDDKRSSAASLLQAARSLMESGNLEGARAKAEEAKSLDVVYGLLDDRPDLVLQEIRFRQNEGLVASSPASAAVEEDAPAAGTPQQNKQLAVQSLRDAREAMRNGDVSAAEQHLRHAERFDVAYDLFDDRPENAREDLNRLIAQGGLPQKTQNIAQQEPRESLKEQALQLLQAARTDLDSGLVDQARVKATQAATYDVSYELFEERPEQLLREIEQVAGRPTQKTTGRTRDASVMNLASLPPSEAYSKGVELLKNGDRDAAYEVFLQVYHSGEEFEPRMRQQLQDKLRELAPRRRVQPTSGELAGNPLQLPEGGRIDAVAKEQSLKFERLHTDCLNVMFRADRMRERQPEEALLLLEQQITAVESSGLDDQKTTALLRMLKDAQGSLESYVAQQKPVLEMERRNTEVKDVIQREIEHRVRIDQEVATLLEKYNELYDQKRFHEAHKIAQQAKAIAPENPAVVAMDIKATIAMRDARNKQLREDKDNAFWEELQNVEESIVSPLAGGKSIAYAKNWDDLKKLRQSRPASARVQTEAEMRVRNSLVNPVSLHFDNQPLAKVLQYISDSQVINVNVDELGLMDEGITASTPVSINVDGIQLKSALNLMLGPLGLDYTIENEVLKITSKLRQQGEMKADVYAVADLVVPVSINNPAVTTQPGQMGSLGAPNPTGGFQSVAPTLGQTGNGFAQIPANPTGGLNPMMPGATGVPSALNGPAQSNFDFETLTSLITTTVAPTSWQEVGGSGSISQHDSTLSLVIRQTQKVHQEISDLLEQLRRLQDLQVTIEVRFITVSDDFFEQIGIDFDFNINDTVGGPKFNEDFTPLRRFGAVDPDFGGPSGDGSSSSSSTGSGSGSGSNNNSAASGLFAPAAPINLVGRDSWPSRTVVGMSSPGTLSSDLDIPFRQGSFDIAQPTFGGFDANAGIQFGMAILSDIEAFMFVRAAQGDRRSNVMFAPKITLFNGRTGSIFSGLQRPFVTSLTPVASAFNIGFQPEIQTLTDGTSLTVQAVVTADRRYVRLGVSPQFTNITDVFTFSFISGGTGGGGGGGNIGGGLGGGGFGGGGFGGGGGGFGGGFGGGGFGGGGGSGGGGNVNAPAGASVTVQQPVQDIVTVSTVVSVPDGGTVLLGGMKTLREGRNMAGVPILNKIPYISRLFKNTGVGRETSSIMLMVTPRIIIQEEEEELLGIPN